MKMKQFYDCKDCTKPVRTKSVNDTLVRLELCPQCYTVRMTRIIGERENKTSTSIISNFLGWFPEIDNKLFHYSRTSIISKFLVWFPEIDNRLFHHFRIVNIKIKVEYKCTNPENRFETFEYTRNPEVEE